MRVYLFIEHFPNPYKPWIDTQLVAMLNAGHDLRIFAEGAYRTTINEEVRKYKLEERTGYFPATLRSLPNHAGTIAGNALTAPLTQTRRVSRVLSSRRSPKENLMVASRAMVLPEEPPDVCYIHNLVAMSALTFLRDLYPDARVCLYFHGGEVGGQHKIGGEREIFASTHAVITGTRFAAGQAVERGCAPDKIAIVPLGFNLADYAPSPSRTYRPGGPLRLVSVGRMSPEKGFVVALQAVKKLVESGHRDLHYRLIGTGIRYAELQEFVRANGIESYVTFLGERSSKQVTDDLEQSDVLILPSLITETWAETQAAVVQEALLMGCLTLTTIAGGVPESNAPIMERFAVPPNDVDAIVRNVREISSLDVPAIAALAKAGREFAARRYDIGPLMEQILNHAVGRLPADHPAWFVPRGAAGRAAGA